MVTIIQLFTCSVRISCSFCLDNSSAVATPTQVLDWRVHCILLQMKFLKIQFVATFFSFFFWVMHFNHYILSECWKFSPFLNFLLHLLAFIEQAQPPLTAGQCSLLYLLASLNQKLPGQQLLLNSAKNLQLLQKEQNLCFSRS